MTADIGPPGHPATKTFSDISVIGVHPTLDLALIQVNDLGNQLLRVPPRDFRNPVTTGDACYVIGNPSAGGRNVLHNSITDGIISAARREVEGGTFIQTTAAINPGNSGGALCNKDGQVVGIVTWKYQQAEGLGFAIPIQGIHRNDFKPISERKGDVEKAIAYEREGTRWFEIARLTHGPERDIARFMAYLCYRMTLSELPNDASPYNNIGMIYQELEQYEIAKAFYKRAVELDPDLGNTWKILGYIANKLGEGLDIEREYYRRGLRSSNLEDASGCLENLGVSYMQQEDFTRAAYCTKWAMVLHHTARRAEHRRRVFQTAIQHLSDAQFEYLRDKDRDFSLDGMEAFARGRIQVAEQPKPDPPIAAPPSLIGPLGSSLEAILKAAPTPGDEGARKRIPEAVTDARPAFGGLYLVLKFEQLGRLGIFNVATADIETYLEMRDADSIYAASGNGLLVYIPSQKIFEIYDLQSFTRTGARDARITGVLTDIDMGLDQPSWAMISYADSGEQLANRHYAILDVSTFQIRALQPVLQHANNTLSRFWNMHYRNRIHVRLNPTGDYFTSWCTSHSPSGFIYGRMSRGPTAHMLYRHEGLGALGISDDGMRIYTTTGKVLDPSGNVVQDFQGSMLFPVQGANMFVQYSRDQTVAVRDGASFRALREFKLPFALETGAWNKDRFTADRQVFASAQLNRLVFINNKGTEILVYTLGDTRFVEEAARGGGGTAPGSTWKQKLAFPAGTRVRVEDAPRGVTYSPDTMTLSWDIPGNHPAGVSTILISVIEPGGEEVYHRIHVTVR